MTGFLITENYVSKKELQKIAKALLIAEQFYEDSWNGKDYILTFKKQL